MCIYKIHPLFLFVQKHGYNIHNHPLIVKITSSIPRNLTRVTCFVVAPPQAGAS